MLRLTCRKGMILLQTLVMAVILSMISVMVMQWVLGRYMIAARTYRSSASKLHAQGWASQLFSQWNFNTADAVSGTKYDSDTGYKQRICVSAAAPANGMRRITLMTNEDDPSSCN